MEWTQEDRVEYNWLIKDLAVIEESNEDFLYEDWIDGLENVAQRHMDMQIENVYLS